MASQKEAQRIIAGTIDLVTPDDKMDASAARLLENFRIDQTNQLRSRRGAVLAQTMGSGNFHTIKLNPNGETVFGVGTGIFVGTGTAVANHTAGTPDGRKLGVATYLGATYIMNQGAQIRLDGTDGWPWTPLPPTAGAMVTGVTPSQITMEEFDGSSGANDVNILANGVLEDAMIADAPTNTDEAIVSFDVVNFQSGSASLRADVQQACTVQIVTKGGFNTTTGGVATDGDQFSVWLAFLDPTMVKAITITLSNAPVAPASQGLTVQCFLAPGSAWDPAKILNQGPGFWTQLQIRRTLNVDAIMAQISAATDSQTSSDLTGQLTQLLQNPAFNVIAQQNPQILGINNTPIAAANAPDFDWTAVVSIEIDVVLAGATVLNVDAEQFSGQVAAAALSGSGQYYVSFVDEAGHDSLPSPVSNTVLLTNQASQLTSIPTSPAANVVERNIWRLGFGVSSALLVGVITDNTTTGPWIDPTTNDVAQGSAVYMPIDRTPPPAARVLTGPFFGKMVAFNTKLHPSRMYWTPAGIPWGWPGSDDEPEGDWEDVGGDDDEVVGVTDHKTLLVVYKLRSIWRIPGDPALVDPVKTNGNVGAVGDAAFCSDGSFDFFVSAEGVYSFNLDSETKISQQIDGIFKGDIVQLDPATFIPPIEPTAIATCALEIANERLRLSYPEAGKKTPNVVLIYNKLTGQWAQERYNGLGFSALAYWGSGLPMTAGAPGGGWYSLENGQTDAGAPIAVRWQTKQFDQGLPDFFKWYSDIELEAWLAPGGGGSVTLTVQAIFGNGTTLVTIGTAVLTQTTKQTFSFRIQENPNFPVPAGGSDYGWRDLNVAIRVTGNATSEIIIGGLYLHWYPEERLAHTFDSGSTDFGLPEKAKQIDYLEFYLTGSGQQLQRTLASDLPGRLLTIRDQADMIAPAGRGDVRFRLASIVEGRNFRLTANDSPSNALFQLHKVRARMRPVGEYIDGSNGEYFESPEFSVAPGRVGELKDFLLDYDCSGPGGQLVLYSDLPGSAFAIRRALPIPFQGGRAPYIFPFEQLADAASDFLPCGQLFKVRLYPPAQGILRLHGRAQFRGRLIGTYFNGANGEVFQTQPVELFGGFGLAREILCTMEAGGPMTLSISREAPGLNLPAVPALQVTLNPATTSQGRVPLSRRLPGNTKGILWRFTLSGPYICRLFELKVFGRRTMTNASGWDWAPVPLDATPDTWADIAMPCGQTPEAFTWVDLPVDVIG